MGGILGGTKPAQSIQPASANGLNIQTSAYGRVIPVVVGTTIVAPNVGWTGNFQSQSGGGGGGGKGGGGGSASSTTYSTGVILFLGEGQINGVGTIWQGSTAYTAAALGFTVFEGTAEQSGWSALEGLTTTTEQHIIPVSAPFTVNVNWMPSSANNFTNKLVVGAAGQTFTAVGGTPLLTNQYSVSAGTYTFHPSNAGQAVNISYQSNNTVPANQALPYPLMGYLANYSLSLGTSSSLPNTSVEVYGRLSNPSSGALDADPSAWATLLLTNNVWGMGNVFPPNLVGGFGVYQSYCLSQGLLISCAYTEQSTAAQALDDLCTCTNSDVVWTTSLNIVPRGDTAVSGNGHSYTPPASCFSLTDDDWLPTSNASTATGAQVSDPLVGSRPDPSTIPNQVTLEYLLCTGAGHRSGYGVHQSARIGEQPDADSAYVRHRQRRPDFSGIAVAPQRSIGNMAGHGRRTPSVYPDRRCRHHCIGGFKRASDPGPGHRIHRTG